MSPEWTHELCAVSLNIPHYEAKKKIRCCHIAQMNDVFDLSLWLRSLPENYRGTLDEDANLILISAVLRVWVPQRFRFELQEFDVFKLTLDPTLANFKLQMATTHPQQELISCMVDGEFSRFIPRAAGISSRWAIQFIPSVVFSDQNINTKHPYDLFRQFVRSKMGPDQPPESVRRVFQHIFPNFGPRARAAAKNEQWHRELPRLLSELTGGSVEVFYTAAENTTLTKCDEGKYLFGLTCVLPWAIDILMQRPNCLMTDTTFRAVRPYSLPILHAIIANESIPIAFGISPTETAQSYSNIYAHITSVSTVLQMSLTPQVIANARPNPRPRGSNADWDEDPASVRDYDLSDQRPEEVWAGEWNPNEAPEPSARPQGTDISQVLLSLPLLTDQGKALASFVKNWKIKWIICHRHIIEWIGSDTLFGHWAARLLRCYDEAEWQRTVNVIKKEMERRQSEWSIHVKGYKSFIRLLGETKKEDTHPLANRAHWALWLRLGCPSTTNSAESVNGHLNAEITVDGDVLINIQVVARHFLKRYESRNTWCGRALRRNAGKCFPSDNIMALPWFSHSRLEFYRKLHNVGTKPVKRSFPVELFCFMIVPRYHETLRNWVLPANFKVPKLSSLDKSPDQLVFTRDSCRTWRTHLCWQIAAMIQKRVGHVIWLARGTQIFANILEIGVNLNIPEDRPADEDSEAEWRCECWLHFREWIADVPDSPPKEIDLVNPLLNRRTDRNSLNPAPIAVNNVQSLQASIGFIGLLNTTNTCYVNAPIQCLMHIEAFHNYFLEWGQTRPSLVSLPDKSTVLSSAYYELQSDMDTVPDCGFIDPARFLATLRVNGWGPVDCQHDTHEFLEFFLPKLDDELVRYNHALWQSQSPDAVDRVAPPPRSIVRDLFFGESRRLYNCKCGAGWNTQENFMILIPYVEETRARVNFTGRLELWAKDNPDPGTKCRFCRYTGRVRSHPAITKLPPYLLIRDFSDTFQETLDMAPFCAFGTQSPTSMKYRLLFLLRFKGTHGNGHYTTYIRMSDSIYCFDDTKVRQTGSFHGEGRIVFVIYQRETD
jgi:ubiquitin C-terminal hydrolase